MTGTVPQLAELLAELSPPTGGECHVWRLPVVAGGWDAFDVLDEHERARHARFIQPADQARYLTAHVGVRLLLGGYLGVPPAALRFGRDCRHCDSADHGKPAVLEPAGALDFSLTHSGDWVAIAVAAAPVGVDVQEIEERTDVAAIGRMVLSPPELAWLDVQPPQRVRAAFFGYWARKEALLKATGHGLALPMAEITLSPPDEPARLVEWSASTPLDGPVRLRDLAMGPHYTGSVAVLTEHPIRVTEAELPAPAG